MEQYDLQSLQNLSQIEKNAFEDEIAHDAELVFQYMIQHVSPTVEGLFPTDILMLHYCSDYTIGQTEFPKFWKLSLGVYYPEEILEDLTERGFITLNEETFCYQCSPLGMEALSHNTHIPFVFCNSFCDMGIWTAHMLAVNAPNVAFRDLVWRRYNQFCMAYIQSRNFTCYRNVRYSMAQFFMYEKKYEAALKILCEIAYIDLSGVGHQFSAAKLRQQMANFFPYETSILRISPKVLDDILEIMDRMLLAKSDLLSVFQKVAQSFSLPFHAFTIQQCRDLLLTELFPNDYSDNATFLTELYEEAEIHCQTWLSQQHENF